MPKKRKLSKSVYENAYKEKDKGGTGRQTYIDWKKIVGKDEDVKFFKPREGTNKINIIPYEVKSKNHPLVKEGKMEIGDLDFMLDVWTHRYIGPSEADVICPKKTYGKPCPICEKASEYYEAGKKEEFGQTKATRRALLNVQPVIRGEVQEIQIWEVSHYLFMKELLEEANACEDGGDIIPFSDIDAGKLVKFRMTLETWQGKPSPKFKSFDFLERDEELDDKIIDQTVSFDEGITLLSYEELEKILYGQDEEEEEAPKKEKKESKKDDEDEEEEKPKKEKDKDEEEEATGGTKPVKNDEEEEKEEKPSKGEKGKCPFGHKWGEADKHGKDCKKCGDTWEECIEA